MIASTWRLGAALSAPGLRLMLRRRLARGKEAAGRLGEREGVDDTPRPAGRLLWLHAASVGEAVSVLPVLSSLTRQAPDLTVLFTTGTVTSARVLEQRLPELGLERVLHRFVPLDVPRWAARFLDHWRPDVAAFVESELWPNMLEGCAFRGIPMMLVNGRMSARSYRSWSRAPGFSRQVIGGFATVHAQSPNYADRLRRLGAKRLEPSGNLKLAAGRLPVDEAELTRLRAVVGDRPVWLAASTHPGEEALAGEVHRRLTASFPGLLTVVAPRHAARGAAVSEALSGAPRRSLGQDPGGEFWIADTMGELGLLFALSPIVFMGRSMVGRGGQNPLEPARFGAAIATGPHTGNFEEVVGRLLAVGGLARVADADALVDWVASMLRDPATRLAAGRAARIVADGEAALPDRVAGALLDLLRR